MRRRTITLAMLLGVISCLASRVGADPIQTMYKIDVLQQCTFLDSDETCKDFRATFPLSLTFDSGITSGQASPDRLTQGYGPPTISDIPLPPLRPDFPPLGPNGRGISEEAVFFADRQVWVRNGGVGISEFRSVNGNDFHRDFSLRASGEFLAQPALGAQSLARFLGTAPVTQFSLADAVERADGGFELVQFVGRVSLEVPSAATPEPASLLLIATGIGCLGFRRRPSAAVSR